MSVRRAALLAVGVLVVTSLGGCGQTGAGPGRSATTPASASPAASSSGSTTPSPRPLAAGWQRISSLGIEIDVPGDWPVNSWNGCGPAPRALVTRAPGAVAGCGSTQAPRFSLLVEREQKVAPRPVPSRSPRSGLTLTLPSPSGSVAVVTGPDGDLVRRIAATVRFVEVDGVGCSTRRPPDPSWDRARPGPAVSLPAAASVAVCHYDRDLLGASTLLTGGAAQAAVRTLTDAAAGPVPDLSPDVCLPGTPEHAPLWLHVRGADGRATDVRIHYDGCQGRRVTTPDGVSQVTDAQLQALLTPLHVGYGFSGDLPDR